MSSDAEPRKTADDPKATSLSRIAGEQSLRLRRLGMSFLSYQVTFIVVVMFWLQALLPLSVVIEFFGAAVLINGTFFVLIKTNVNLRFKDPALTALQIVASALPPLWVMYFLEAAQARTIFLLIAVVPALYGILALKTRDFFIVAGCFVLAYIGLVFAVWLTKPEILDLSLELVQIFAYFLVMAQIAMIGGFISGLRGKLRKKNLELKHAMARISELVNIDELTGVCNRRKLFEVLAEETNRFSRTQGPFSVCILDIDFFKQVNDTFGHQAGDQILRQVAQTVSQSLRQIDCFGRYGGEEFLMILPQTSLEGARVKAERVRSDVAALQFDGIEPEFSITVSIGVAQCRKEDSAEDTIARADQALYIAKQKGRNQTAMETPPPEPSNEHTSMMIK
ncbi:MAG: GGDEF domain-containing protein [Alteromonadaceae bacterium]|nr:GGDEF domain-containing protein [Alteromonadaceae bacterium]MBH85937.1 GGDEF domain-containing protein [Alteromonadaceae bacterium]|tara:strand:- start:52 stop:1233 length:1182 start_codon:yes stop_codon:yes gene_type:complete